MQGTIFFISHDRYFINKVAQRLVAIEGTKLNAYAGNYDFYRETRCERSVRTTMAIKTADVVIKPNTTDMKIAVETEYVKYKSKRAVKMLTSEAQAEKIEATEIAIRTLDVAMEVASQDYEKLEALYWEKEVLTKTLNALWAEWTLAMETAQ